MSEHWYCVGCAKTFPRQPGIDNAWCEDCQRYMGCVWDDDETLIVHFESGAVRSMMNDVRYDLITPYGLRRLAQTYAEGSVKYGDRNWENGIPLGNLLNHALAHLTQYMAGDKSEDHLAHAVWNLMAIMHFEEVGTMGEGETR